MSSFLCHQVTNTTAYVPPLAKEPVHYNVDQWIEENEKYFLPPVCNKMMHNTQLKVWSTSLITVETLINNVFSVSTTNIINIWWFHDRFSMLAGQTKEKITIWRKEKSFSSCERGIWHWKLWSRVSQKMFTLKKVRFFSFLPEFLTLHKDKQIPLVSEIYLHHILFLFQ